MGKTKTTEEFIKEAKKIHNNKFDYKGEYQGQFTPMIAICPIHGEFEIIPKNHLRGTGCKKCNKTERITTEIFIQRCKEKFGDLYDYTNTEYVNENTYIEYICPKHGKVIQLPFNHLKYGCGKCGQENGNQKKRQTFEEFVKKAKELHGDKYQYFESEYKGYNKKTLIYCNKCKSYFTQTPAKHLCGHGCTNCKEYKLEVQIKNLLNVNKIEYIFQATSRQVPQLKKQTFDFYLPSKKIAIECQGKQHFINNDFFGGEIVKERDLKKKKICEDNGITLLYYSNLKIDYPYKVYTNINDILTIIQNTI